MLPFIAGLEDSPQVVLQMMLKYVKDFFGCRACAQHFEEMAQGSLSSVKTLEEAVLWLWEKHNVVNAKLAGRGKSPCFIDPASEVTFYCASFSCYYI